MTLSTIKRSRIIKSISIIIICQLLINDVYALSLADTSSQKSTLAIQSRFKPFSENYGLDFQSMSSAIMAACELKKLVSDKDLRDGEIYAKIDELNAILKKGSIAIKRPGRSTGYILKSNLSSGREYKYATISFKNGKKSFEILFFEDPASLTAAELAELNIKGAERDYLFTPGLEGVWFVGKSRPHPQNIKGLSSQNKDSAPLSKPASVGVTPSASGTAAIPDSQAVRNSAKNDKSTASEIEQPTSDRSSYGMALFGLEDLEPSIMLGLLFVGGIIVIGIIAYKIYKMRIKKKAWFKEDLKSRWKEIEKMYSEGLGDSNRRAVKEKFEELQAAFNLVDSEKIGYRRLKQVHRDVATFEDRINSLYKKELIALENEIKKELSEFRRYVGRLGKAVQIPRDQISAFSLFINNEENAFRNTSQNKNTLKEMLFRIKGKKDELEHIVPKSSPELPVARKQVVSADIASPAKTVMAICDETLKLYQDNLSKIYSSEYINKVDARILQQFLVASRTRSKERLESSVSALKAFKDILQRALSELEKVSPISDNIRLLEGRLSTVQKNLERPSAEQTSGKQTVAERTGGEQTDFKKFKSAMGNDFNVLLGTFGMLGREDELKGLDIEGIYAIFHSAFIEKVKKTSENDRIALNGLMGKVKSIRHKEFLRRKQGKEYKPDSMKDGKPKSMNGMMIFGGGPVVFILLYLNLCIQRETIIRWLKTKSGRDRWYSPPASFAARLAETFLLDLTKYRITRYIATSLSAPGLTIQYTDDQSNPVDENTPAAEPPSFSYFSDKAPAKYLLDRIDFENAKKEKWSKDVTSYETDNAQIKNRLLDRILLGVMRNKGQSALAALLIYNSIKTCKPKLITFKNYPLLFAFQPTDGNLIYYVDISEMLCDADDSKIIAPKILEELKKEFEEKISPVMWPGQKKELRRLYICNWLSVDKYGIAALPILPGTYAPSAYSHALIETVLPLTKDNDKILTIGSGSGIDPIAFAKNRDVIVHATDINLSAFAATTAAVNLNEVAKKVEVFYGDMFSGLTTGEKYDVITFHAPRICRSSEVPFEGADANLYDIDGKIMNALLKDLMQFLKPGGKLYIMLIPWRGYPESILKGMLSKYNLSLKALSLYDEGEEDPYAICEITPVEPPQSDFKGPEKVVTDKNSGSTQLLPDTALWEKGVDTQAYWHNLAEKFNGDAPSEVTADDIRFEFLDFMRQPWEFTQLIIDSGEFKRRVMDHYGATGREEYEKIVAALKKLRGMILSNEPIQELSLSVPSDIRERWNAVLKEYIGRPFISGITDEHISAFEKIIDRQTAGNPADQAEAAAYKEKFRGSKDLTQNYPHVPWRISLDYLLVKILEATDYWSNNVDPYIETKETGCIKGVETFVKNVDLNSFSVREAEGKEGIRSALEEMQDILLTGNMHSDPTNKTTGDKSDIYMVNDKRRAAEYLLELQEATKRGEKKEIHIFHDNVGLELVSVFWLIDFCIRNKIVTKFVLHTKNYPYCVSDVAGEKDFEMQLEAMVRYGGTMEQLANRIRDYIGRTHNIEIDKPHWFLTLGQDISDMPKDLYSKLQNADLIITLGDFLYRKAFLHRNWKHTADSKQILSYFPAPVLVARIVKSPMLAGVDEKTAATLDLDNDNSWWKSYKFGVLDFVPNGKNNDRALLPDITKVGPIDYVSEESDRIHRENLDKTRLIPANKILCHIIADSILPIGQRGVLKTIEQDMRKNESKDDMEYKEKIVCLNMDGVKDFAKEVRDRMAEISTNYSKMGYEVEFTVACPSTKLLEDLTKDNPALNTLAFNLSEESGVDVAQIEGIILALRTLRIGDIDELKRIYKLLAGDKFSDEYMDLNDIIKFTRLKLFIISAAKVDLQYIKNINDLIKKNILAAA